MLPFITIGPSGIVKAYGTCASPYIYIVISIPYVYMRVYVVPVAVRRIGSPVVIIGRIITIIPR